MSVNVKIPTPLRTLTAGQAEIQVEAATVEEALRKLNGEFNGIGERIFDENGELRRFINVYVNEDNIKDRSHLATEIQSGDTISILPSIAGGRQHSRSGRRASATETSPWASLSMSE